MKTYQEKKKELYEKLEEYTRENICVAFSGGADSSLLLKAVKEAKDRKKGKGQIYAVTFDTALHPPCDLEIAKKVAGETGVFHKVLRINELEQEEICQNPPDRCYHCKKLLFQKLTEYAREEKAVRILEGTNADDLLVYRPGLRAVKELGILSPLAEAGFTKEEVRRLAKESGISVASRPASPCLATRLPYGARLQPQVLKQIARGEAYLREKGFPTVRLRLHGNLARIEIPRADFAAFLENSSEMVLFLKNLGFPYITLDLEGFRSGSMDEVLKKK